MVVQNFASKHYRKKSNKQQKKMTAAPDMENDNDRRRAIAAPPFKAGQFVEIEHANTNAVDTQQAVLFKNRQRLAHPYIYK
jgi:hypothetical protein